MCRMFTVEVKRWLVEMFGEESAMCESTSKLSALTEMASAAEGFAGVSQFAGGGGVLVQV
jgi:hypothetical protein